MAFLTVPGVEVKGISACLPKKVLDNNFYPGFTNDEALKFISTTGVERHRLAEKSHCTSDLCFQAAERLICDLKWEKEDIDCLILVSQSFDYLLPATSCLLQERLGLKESTFALDISLGCSGWIYGLQVISSLISHGQMKKGILLAGDTTLKPCSEEDKSTYPLFGDAGTATAIEFCNDSIGFKFHTAVDGKGYEAIIIRDGGFRNQVQLSSFEMVEFEPGIKHNRLQYSLDGMNVFSFGISKAPESVKLLSEHFDVNLESVDYFLFHQANFYMNEKIRKKLKLPFEKVPYSLKEFGNTSSASIPLTMVTEIGHALKERSCSVVACGFGVGLSWGSV